MKDAKSDLTLDARVIAETDLAYYAGNDAEVLPWLAVGAVGLVGTATQLVGPDSPRCSRRGRRATTAEALRLHRKLWPIFTGIFATQGAILAKAGLRLLGRDPGPVRLPLVDATEHQISHLPPTCERPASTSDGGAAWRHLPAPLDGYGCRRATHADALPSDRLPRQGLDRPVEALDPRPEHDGEPACGRRHRGRRVGLARGRRGRGRPGPGRRRRQCHRP